MQKILLMATTLVVTAGACLGPTLSADLGDAPESAPPTPAPTAVPPSGAYTFGLLYTGELWDNVSGGLRLGESYMNTVDAKFEVDTEKAFGWTGGSFVAEGYYANPVSTNAQYLGTINEESVIDTATGVTMLRVYQLYYDENFGSTDVRLGIYDLENEFSIMKPMTLFLNDNFLSNTAYGHSGTAPSGGVVGPGTYPFTPLALRIRQTVAPNLSFQFVVADGAGDNPNNYAQNAVLFSPAYGALFVGEADYTPDKYTKLMAGAWGLTSELPYFGRLNPDGSQRMTYGEEGAYIGGSTRLYGASGKRGLDGFMTIGASTPQSTDVAESLNAGLVYTGLFDIRPVDKIGVAMNINVASPNIRQMQAMQGATITNTETTFEATYRAKINEYLTIQPDIQYIMHASYGSTPKNPLAFGIHFELAQVFKW